MIWMWCFFDDNDDDNDDWWLIICIIEYVDIVNDIWYIWMWWNIVIDEYLFVYFCNLYFIYLMLNV